MTFRVKFMSLALRVACDTVSVSVPLYSHRASYIPVVLECSQVPKPRGWATHLVFMTFFQYLALLLVDLLFTFISTGD